MIKYIYEVARNCYDVVIGKNKHTVVYENKKYYYCKVNGSDELKQIIKERVDDDRYKRFFSKSQDTEIYDKELEETLRNKTIAKLNRDIKMYESQLIQMSENITRLNRSIESNRIQVAKFEKERDIKNEE